MSDDYILLKWGSIKGWDMSENKEAFKHLKKYHEQPVSMSAAMQKDTPEQKQALIDMINCFDGEIINDWDGKKYTKEQAIKYIAEYGDD